MYQVYPSLTFLLNSAILNWMDMLDNLGSQF
jgi:hypothetical protein